MNEATVRVPYRVVFARVRFDDGRAPVNTADLMFPCPGERYRLGVMGMRVQVAGSLPWSANRALPGVPFGTAVAETLPRSVLNEVLRGNGGYAFTDLEVADFLRPVLDEVARSERILAGVPSPPSADPVYVRMSPVMLPYWRFIAGDDRAEPIHSGAVEYFALRVFTQAEFAFVDLNGGKLRPIPAAPAVCSTALAAHGQPKTAGSKAARSWMAQNITGPGAWKMEAAIAACRNAVSCSYREAKSAWGGLPDHLRGARGKRK